jgi:hypothetical protein
MASVRSDGHIDVPPLWSALSPFLGTADLYRQTDRTASVAVGVAANPGHRRPRQFFSRRLVMDIERTYDYRRGHIEVVNRSTGLLRCRECGAKWWAQSWGNIRPREGGHSYRGAWTCYKCGANSEGGFSAARYPEL